ncbi:hypothetical protein N9E56_01470 [Flavobacteriaceae bacterium]|nr:hypothetical protein [Flavobacteriaceae bacterium]
MNINEILKNKLNNFTRILENKNESERKLYHYRSVLNLVNGLLLVGHKNSLSLKKLMIEYFKSLEELNYLMDQTNSLQFYKNYLLPVGQYLAEARGFRSKSDIFKYIILGLVIDFSVFFIFEFKLFGFTLVLFLIGYNKLRRKKKSNKFFSINW